MTARLAFAARPFGITAQRNGAGGRTGTARPTPVSQHFRPAPGPAVPPAH